MLSRGIATVVATLLAAGAAIAGDSTVRERGDGVLPLGETEAIDGVLPLRLPSDGVLPLRLTGQATEMSGQLPSVTTEIVITKAVRTSIPLAQSGTLVCQQPEDKISKHVAAGTVKVGGSTYTIKGICYNHENKNMEVVAERSLNATTLERSFMIGLLPAEQPQQFQGRLLINGQAGHTGRYAFTTHTVEIRDPQRGEEPYGNEP